MRERNTTDVLQGDLEDDENVRWLYERFLEEIEKAIEARLPDGLSAKVDTEVLASTTLRQAIEHLKKNAAFRASSEVFRALLLDIAKKKSLNGIESQFRQKRDARREVDASDKPGMFASKGREKEIDRASAREQMREGIAKLLDENDATRAMINLLGVAMEVKTPDIEAILKKHPDKFKAYSLPTIRTQIETARKRIRQFEQELEEGERKEDLPNE